MRVYFFDLGMLEFSYRGMLGYDELCNSYILQIDARTDRHTYGRLDGHTDLRIHPNCIVIKKM